MNDTEFEQLIVQAIAQIPKEFQEKMENVAIVIADWPSPQQQQIMRQKQQPGLLLGLYEGIPKTKRNNYGVGMNLPDKITIFKQPLLLISPTTEQLIQNIKDTLVHEIGHHFGLSEADIQRAQRE